MSKGEPKTSEGARPKMSRMRETGFKKLAGNTAVTSISPDRDVEFKYF